MEWREDWRPKRRYHSCVLSEEDLEAYPCWYLDAAHSIPPWTPLFAWVWTHHQRYGDLWAAETMGLPTCRGTDWREVDGCAYMCPVLVADESEKRARQERFKKHLIPFIEDYDGLWAEVVAELTRSYRRFKAFEVDEAHNAALCDHFREVFSFDYRVWGLHSWMMYTLFALYSLFEDLCRERVGIDDASSTWHRLIRGFDNKLFEVDRRLWKLARRAADLGLEGLILNTPQSEVVAALKESQAGRRWLAEPGGFEEFIQEHGWRLPRMMELDRPAWIEDPGPALSFIKQYLDGGVSFEMDARRPGLVKERREAEAEVLSRFPPSQRGWVERLMTLTQKAGVFSEEHDYYFEHTAHALMRRAALACARRMAARGLMEEPEDFVFLLPDEIGRNVMSLSLDYRPLVAERRAYFEEYSTRLDRPPLIGRLADDPQKAMDYVLAAKDYVMLKVTVGLQAAASPDLGADLYGNPAAPGLSQGAARLIATESDIPKIKPGDILVAVTTYSSWTPVYPLINGVVLDSGASLSHAAIVGREYNIPVVVQTKEATTKLKDGQQIRVDGNRGAVWILGGGA